MGLAKAILRYWIHPLARNIQVDSSGSVKIHKEIILSKPLLQWVYASWYKSVLPSVQATAHLNFPMVELGCGVSQLEHYVPQVIKTDVVKHFNAQRVVDAQKLPFENSSLRMIFMMGVFHHLVNPEIFLSEAQRTLAKGSRLVLIEPSHSPINRFITHYFHPYEIYDGSVLEWKNNTVTGRLSGANEALPWIVFERDREKFNLKFPQLKIVKIKRHTILLYFLCGGLSYRSFIPSFLLPLVKFLGFLLYPLGLWLGCVMTIEVEKV